MIICDNRKQIDRQTDLSENVKRKDEKTGDGEL